jgi:hypothetical protein
MRSGGLLGYCVSRGSSGSAPRGSWSVASATHVIETVYRHVIVATVRCQVTVMDSVFGAENEESA